MPHSINSEGLKRRGFTPEQIRNLKNAYRVLYRSDLKLADAVAELQGARRDAARAQDLRRLHRRVDAQPRALDRMRIALVAGEASGDTLGAALIEALRRRFPGAEFAGVAGPRMKAAGCAAWYDIEELAVMGLTEVLRAPAAARGACARAAPAHPRLAARRLHRRRLQGIQSRAGASA